MPLTVVVTRNVESRYRGFLTSVMLEVSAGVYVAPNMSHGVRDRTWSVISDWWATGTPPRSRNWMPWTIKGATIAPRH